MLKLILSIVAGVVIAFAVVFATDALFHSISSVPVPADTKDPEAMRLYVASQPAGVLTAMLVGWALAAFAGSAVAARFAGRGHWPGWIVAGLFLLATVSNFLLVSHPTWMVAAGLALTLAAGWFGTRTGANLSPRPV